MRAFIFIVKFYDESLIKPEILVDKTGVIVYMQKTIKNTSRTRRLGLKFSRVNLKFIYIKEATYVYEGKVI